MDGGFFVAQAIPLSKACVHEMPARHDQEGAPQVGSNGWKPHPQVACKPLALLGEQAEASVAGDTQSPWPGPADRVWQTFNLYALWTTRFGQTHGVPCPQVRSGGRLASPRCRSCLPYANNLGRSRLGRHRLASNICASAQAAAPRAAHGLDTHARSAIGQWMCGPRRRSDEGCVKSLTPHWASSPKSELRHFARRPERTRRCSMQVDAGPT